MKFKLNAVLAGALLIAATITTTWAATGQFGSVTPITQPSPSADDELGFSLAGNNPVALSGDGLTAMIAVPSTNVTPDIYAGKVYIFNYVAGKWSLTQEIDDPDTVDGFKFGLALALNGDGTVALIGSASAVSGQTGAGRAYIYTLTGGAWTKTIELDDPVAAMDDSFGATGLALSADGKTALIGAAGTTVSGSGQAGEAYIYTQSGGTWALVASLPDPTPGLSAQFGYAVALSADGLSALASEDERAYLFTLSSGVWSQAHEFDDPHAFPGQGFGNSLGLSSDGHTAILGAPGYSPNADLTMGVVYIYTGSGSTWTQTGEIDNPDNGSQGFFGHPVALSADGASALIGSHSDVNGHSEAGKAYLYTLSKGAWTKSVELDDPADAANDSFGGSGLALSADATTAFVNAVGTVQPGFLQNTGEAYIYQPATQSSGGSGGTSSGGGKSGGGTLGWLPLLMLLGAGIVKKSRR